MRGSRRNFIKYGAYISGTVFATAAWMRGVRYPGLRLEPSDVKTTYSANGIAARADGAFVRDISGQTSAWRAHSPEPRLVLDGSGEFEIDINNVHPRATLQIAGKGHISNEKVAGLSRVVQGNITETPLTLEWKFSDAANYRFAAIGDTGGDEELRWVLKRSAQLDADFLLHLGDFNYQAGDYKRTESAFDEAAIPTYVTLGNHDYRAPGEDDLVSTFTSRMGPLNHAFTLGGIEFINIDSAANTLPFSAGPRGQLLTRLGLAANGVRQRIAFFHRPITDPRGAPQGGDHNDHDIGGYGEGRWLHGQLRRLGVDTALNGHIHMQLEFDDEGLFTRISGQGLAHADILTGQRVAQILVGTVTPGERVLFEWAALEMPVAAHCNTRLRKILKKMGKGELENELAELCQSS